MSAIILFVPGPPAPALSTQPPAPPLEVVTMSISPAPRSSTPPGEPSVPTHRRRPGRRLRSIIRPAIGALGAAALMFGACSAAPAASSSTLTWGLYSGPGWKDPAGAKSFAAASGITIGRMLDFLPDDSWTAMTHATWLIDAHRDRRYGFELSVPMLPRAPETNLATCATGAYNGYWRTIARQLVAAGRSDTVLRPGWEMNGNWYRWSARGQANNYIGCFRQLVTTMRSVNKSLRFDWSVNNGDNVVDAATLFPGTSYVDFIGVDLYNYDYHPFPRPAMAQSDSARSDAWTYNLKGRRGLAFWAGYAHRQSKPMVMSEWGLSWRADGRAGGDDTVFVRGVYAFVTARSNNVAWATYFNNTDSAGLKHNLTVKGSVFPKARATFFALAKS